MPSRNKKFWYDKSSARSEDIQRRKTPVHYRLKKNDLVGALAELRAGADPGVVDNTGRTCLDLSIEILADIFQTIFSTSYVTDYIDESSLRSCTVPRYEETYRNLYDHFEKYYNKDNFNPFTNKIPIKYITKLYPDPSTKVICQKQEDFSKSLLPRKSESDEKNTHSETKSKFPIPERLEEPTESAGFESIMMNVKFVLRTALREPLHPVHLSRIKSIQQRLKGFAGFVLKVAECRCLKNLSKVTAVLAMQCLTYPFLYIALMDFYFQKYPSDLGGEPWDADNPYDAKRLVNVIKKKKIRGCELIYLFESSLHYIVKLIDCFGPDLLTNESEIAQYWMHMAFVLDSPDLFEFYARNPKIFAAGDIFNWEELLFELLNNNSESPRYSNSMIYSRLRARLHRKFSEGHEFNNTDIGISIPIQERFLQKRIIESCSKYFGRDEAAKLTELLSRWNNEAYRLV